MQYLWKIQDKDAQDLLLLFETKANYLTGNEKSLMEKTPSGFLKSSNLGKIKQLVLLFSFRIFC